MAFSSLTLLFMSLSYHSNIKLIDKTTNWKKKKKKSSRKQEVGTAQSTQLPLQRVNEAAQSSKLRCRMQKHVEMPEASVCPQGRTFSRALLKPLEVPVRDREPRLWSMDSGTTGRLSLPLCFALPKTCPKGPWALIRIIVITRSLFIHILHGFVLSVDDGDF